MSADPPSSARPGIRRPTNPITTSQVEVAASTATSLLGLVFALQTIPPLLGQLQLMLTPVGLTLTVAVFGSLIIAGLAAIFRQWTRPAFGAVAAIYLVALLAWPLVVGAIANHDVPWIYYLCNVATACAIVAAPIRWGYALAYTVLTPVVVWLIRTTPSGGGLSVLEASLDAFYCLIIGLVMLVIIVSLRQAARSVDLAQSYALESYARAVRNHATESERVRVDALVHDNVLITLLSAARARTAESKSLAARMARNAIMHLNDAQNTFPGSASDVGIEELAGRLRLAIVEQRVAFDVHVRITERGELPSDVAEAIAEAAAQAMVNSANHADVPGRAVHRYVRVSSAVSSQFSVEVEVGDDGKGFDIESIPAERLGVRTSIIERMSLVGGTARVQSALGRGTVVSLVWPAGADVENEALRADAVDSRGQGVFS